MPNSDFLMSEEELAKAEEAGHLTPVETKPVVAGESTPAQPFAGPRTDPYFSGSLPPQFQLDSNFSRARTISDRVPKSSLMPFGVQSNPSTNAAIQSTSKTVVESVPDVDVDNDTPIVNLQTGTSYTVQQGDLNKVISINNAIGGNIYLPPITLSTTVSLNNKVGSAVGSAFFNAGNTTTLGQVATSVATWTIAGTGIQAGDTMMCCVRLIAGGAGSSVTATLTDPVNGSWTGIFQQVNQATTGDELMCFFYVRSQSNIAVGGTLTLTLKATYSGSVFNPDVNTVWNMTGLTFVEQIAQTSGAGAGGGSFTFGTAGVSTTKADTFFAFGDDDHGGIQSPFTPAPTGGINWTDIQGSGGTAMCAAALFGFPQGSVIDVWTSSGTPNDEWGAILVSFVNALPSDVQQFPNNFFCYVENKGLGIFNLVSAFPIDGSNQPLPLSQNQGVLLVYDSVSHGWYTVRGIGGGTDVDFYQTVQQAGASKPQEGKLNFLGPITATDNAGNGSTDIAVPDMVGDSGSGGVHGLAPAPGAGDAAAGKFLKASGSFATPPTMVGDSGSGGTAGYAPAPGAGDNAAGKFLSAGGTYVNPGSNPASFNTGLVYAIAAGYALG